MELFPTVKGLWSSHVGFAGGRCPHALISCVRSLEKVAEVTHGKKGAYPMLKKLVDELIMNWEFGTASNRASVHDALSLFENVQRESREKTNACGLALADVLATLPALVSSTPVSTAEVEQQLVSFLLRRREEGRDEGGDTTGSDGDDVNTAEARSVIMAAIQSDTDAKRAQLLAHGALLAKSPTMRSLATLSAISASEASSDPMVSLQAMLASIGRLECIAHELTSVASTNDTARVDWSLAQPLLGALALVRAGCANDDTTSWQCAASLACIGLWQLERRQLLATRASTFEVRDDSPSPLAVSPPSMGQWLTPRALGQIDTEDKSTEIVMASAPAADGPLGMEGDVLSFEAARGQVNFAGEKLQQFLAPEEDVQLIESFKEETTYQDVLRNLQSLVRDARKELEAAFIPLHTRELAREFYKGGQNVSNQRALSATELLYGMPILASAAERWCRAFNHMHSLSQFAQRDSTGFLGLGGSAEAEQQLMISYLQTGASLACAMDMVNERLLNVGPAATACSLHNEAAQVHKRLSSFGLNDSKLKHMLKVLNLGGKASEEDDNEDDGKDARNPLLNPKEKRTAKLKEVDSDDEEEAEQAPQTDPASGEMGSMDVVISDADVLDGKQMAARGAGGQGGGMGPAGLGRGAGGGGGGGDSDANKKERDRLKALDEAMAAEQQQMEEAMFGDDDDFELETHGEGQRGGKTTTVNVDFELAQSGFLQRFKDDNNLAQALYEQQGAAGEGPIGARVMELSEELQEMKVDVWTYLLLAEDAAIQGMVQVMLHECRAVLAEQLRSSSPVKVQWCIVIDNSGSMIRIRNQLAEGTVMVRAMPLELGKQNQQTLLQALRWSTDA